MRVINLSEEDMRPDCEHNNLATCGTCQRQWCFTCNPTPSARCLYEYEHDDVFDDDELDYEDDLEARDESIVNDILRENKLRNQINPQANGPCPVCGEPDGFHDDSKHRKNIDPKYLKEKGWHHASKCGQKVDK